jgi:hypothetical protein
MYPGYSPADHIYGEAASEFGKQMAELKKQGIELPKDPNGPEYDLAADKKLTQTQIEEIKKQREQEKKGAESGSLVDSADDKADPMEGVEETDVSQLFVIDSNPTPVPPFQANFSTSLTKSKNKANDKAKRRNSNDGDITGEPAVEKTHKKKKVMVSADSTDPTESVNDDFEKEAEAKHKEREEKRKAKKDKKRKRDSEPSELAAEVPDASVEDSKAEKPKKKKSKKDKGKGVTESSEEPAAEAKTDDGEKIKKRKKKTSEDTPEVVDGGEKKKRKKDKEAA